MEAASSDTGGQLGSDLRQGTERNAAWFHAATMAFGAVVDRHTATVLDRRS